jgi:Ca2+-binding RTX toxin-like protein
MADVAGNKTTKAVLETALSSDLIGTYSGRIEAPGDHDWVRVNLVQGVNYNIFLSLQSTGSQEGDSEFVLRDATGALVNPNVGNNDLGPGFHNSFTAFSVPSTGIYYIDVFSHIATERGDYSLLLTSLVAGRLNAFFGTNDDGITAGATERDSGGAGDDTIDLSTAGRDALGDQGDDLLFGNSLANILSGGIGNEILLGSAGDDILFGDAGDDVLDGGDNDDQLFGGNGADELGGGTGNDRLAGGADNDFLTGNNGSDLFVFKSVTDSVKGPGRDQIIDFTHGDGDQIDLHLIDANTHKAHDQKFHFIGSHGFGHHEGELRFKGGMLAGDVNGNGKADFEIHVTLVDVTHLIKADFVL